MDDGDFVGKRGEGVAGAALDAADFLDGVTSGGLDGAADLEGLLRGAHHGGRGRGG